MNTFDLGVPTIPSNAAAVFGNIAMNGDEYVRCITCGYGGCDVRVSGCGCTFHAVRFLNPYLSLLSLSVGLLAVFKEARISLQVVNFCWRGPTMAISANKEKISRVSWQIISFEVRGVARRAQYKLYVLTSASLLPAALNLSTK